MEYSCQTVKWLRDGFPDPAITWQRKVSFKNIITDKVIFREIAVIQTKLNKNQPLF